MPWAQLVVQALDSCVCIYMHACINACDIVCHRMYIWRSYKADAHCMVVPMLLLLFKVHWQVYAMHHNATLSMPTMDI